MAVGILSAVTRSILQGDSMQVPIVIPRFRRVQVTNRLLREKPAAVLLHFAQGLGGEFLRMLRLPSAITSSVMQRRFYALLHDHSTFTITPLPV